MNLPKKLSISSFIFVFIFASLPLQVQAKLERPGFNKHRKSRSGRPKKPSISAPKLKPVTIKNKFIRKLPDSTTKLKPVTLPTPARRYDDKNPAIKTIDKPIVPIR